VNIGLEEFLNLSAALTGFNRGHLIGTGVGLEYLDTLRRIVPGDILDRLLEDFALRPATESALQELVERVLDEESMGPVARNIIVMWYTGTWTSMPEAWCAVHGRAAADSGHVVSSAAYLAGLQWATIAAHPPGGLPPGFASWASLPTGVES